MRLYGLTGGIGAGKSEAARRFAEHGIPVLDADKLGHEVLEAGGAAEAAVRSAFGPEILSGGAIDREKLGALVFSDATSRARLNAIVHPAIHTAVAQRCAALAQSGHRAAIVEAALIGEGGKRDPWLDGLILVLADAAVRIERLRERRGMPMEEAARRIAAQTPPEEKQAITDWVIKNNGGLAELHAQVDAITAAILA